jgi:hypothetical protein
VRYAKTAGGQPVPIREEEPVSESRYVPLEKRAGWLIEKGTEAWQRLQRLAMTEDELLDSVVLLGQELWLPHHETDGALYAVTLRIAVHYPAASRAAAEARVGAFFTQVEAELTDDRGQVRIAAEVR